MAKKLKPVHPGEILREEPHDLSMNRLATDLGVPVPRVAEIYHQRRGITTDTALRLARYLNTSAVFWVNLQWWYELEIAEDREATRIVRDMRPLQPASSR